MKRPSSPGAGYVPPAEFLAIPTGLFKRHGNAKPSDYDAILQYQLDLDAKAREDARRRKQQLIEENRRTWDRQRLELQHQRDAERREVAREYSLVVQEIDTYHKDLERQAREQQQRIDRLKVEREEQLKDLQERDRKDREARRFQEWMEEQRRLEENRAEEERKRQERERSAIEVRPPLSRLGDGVGLRICARGGPERAHVPHPHRPARRSRTMQSGWRRGGFTSRRSGSRTGGWRRRHCACRRSGRPPG